MYTWALSAILFWSTQSCVSSYWEAWPTQIQYVAPSAIKSELNTLYCSNMTDNTIQYFGMKLYYRLYTCNKKLRTNTNRPWHCRHSAMPRDIIWQLSALIGVLQGGRQIQALYQAYKGALSGSYSISACLLCVRAHVQVWGCLCVRRTGVSDPLWDNACYHLCHYSVHLPYYLHVGIWPSVCVLPPSDSSGVIKCSELQRIQVVGTVIS